MKSFHVRVTNDATCTFIDMGVKTKDMILQALSLSSDSWQAEELDDLSIGGFTAFEVGLPVWQEITRIS